MFIHHVMHRLIDLVLPRSCILCQHATHRSMNICQPCEQDLPILSDFCRKCAQYSPNHHQRLCGQCLRRPPPFDQAFALYRYIDPVPHLISALKFKHQLSHAQTLGQLLARAVRQQWYHNRHLPERIIPVPLHVKRLQERGFNQAVELARPISQHCRIPIDYRGTSRHKYTEQQSNLAAAKRQANVAGSFKCHTDYTGRHIAVLDDVMTTGETMRAFCTELRRHGARQIDVWCCARV